MRVLVNTPATVSESWYQGDTIADPGTVAVTVKADDGTTVATGNAAGTGAAPRSFNVPAVAQLDTLTVTWGSATLGTITSSVEVVGGFLFALADLRAIVGAGPTDDQLTGIRTRVEQAIEDACGCAFVPRYDRESLNGDGTTLLRLGRPFLRRIRWASTVLAGVTRVLLPADITGLSVSSAGFVSGYRWPVGYGSVLVGYEHGMDRPPEPVKAAALDYARFLLTQDSSIDSRAERLITDDGTLVFGSGAIGLPSVDRVIDQYRLPTVA